MPERPSPKIVLGRVDALLSKAQNELTSIVNEDVKRSSPDAFRVGDEFWEKLERLRWELREKITRGRGR